MADNLARCTAEILRMDRPLSHEFRVHLADIIKASSSLYEFLHKVVGDPGDPNALATISAEEVTAEGIRERLETLGKLLDPPPRIEKE